MNLYFVEEFERESKLRGLLHFICMLNIFSHFTQTHSSSTLLVGVIPLYLKDEEGVFFC
jgi:hypothetical protein